MHWTWLLCALYVGLAVSTATPQSVAPFNERDDRYRLLGLKRAKEQFEVARAEFDRQKALYERKLITQVELDRAKAVFADAEVNYYQSLLAVLFEQQFVSVTSAVKYHSRDGGRRVKLTIVNTSEATAELQKLVNIDDQLFRSLQPDVINNVYVSLLNEEGAIISQPYEIKVPVLKAGEPHKVDFTLLQDLDAVTVSIIYGSGTQRQLRIFLQKDATVNRVAIQSEQFSQEVELGQTANYDLTLELYSGAGSSVQMEVLNLPTAISRTFVDAGGSARLSQIRFTESAHSKRVSLRVTLPDRYSESIPIDKPISFLVAAVPTERAVEIDRTSSKIWTEADLNALGAGFARFELIPRGRGKLLVRAPQLFVTTSAGLGAPVTLDIVNEGTQRLDNIELAVDLPLQWQKELSPTQIEVLEVSRENRVTLTIRPPDDVAPGKYEVRLKATALSNGLPVTGEDKTITVEIQAEANLLGTSLIVLLIIGLVAGMVTFGIRLARR